MKGWCREMSEKKISMIINLVDWMETKEQLWLFFFRHPGPWQCNAEAPTIQEMQPVSPSVDVGWLCNSLWPTEVESNRRARTCTLRLLDLGSTMWTNVEKLAREWKTTWSMVSWLDCISCDPCWHYNTRGSWSKGPMLQSFTKMSS